MKFGNIKSVSPIEIVLFVAFVIYLVFPIATPDVLANVVDTPLGIITLFVITLSLFVYTNPILGIIYIFVAYELLRRSHKTVPINIPSYIPSTPNASASPNQAAKNAEMAKMNPPKATTLEEEVILKMAPIGHSDQSTYIDTTFKPVSENTKNAAAV